MLTFGVALGNSAAVFSFWSRSRLIRELIRGAIGGSRGLLEDMGRLQRIMRMCGRAGEKALARCGQ